MPATRFPSRRGRRRSPPHRHFPRAIGAEPLERRLPLAVTTPFGVRFTTDTTGDITFAANTLMTAPAGDPAAIDAQNGVGSKVNNNDFAMAYVDIDSDGTTFNSSAAALVLPADAKVLFAGLYWSGRTSTSAAPGGQTQGRDTVKLMAPGDLAYRGLIGSIIGTTGSSYQAFADVTGIVQSDKGGAGRYMVADVHAIAGSDDKYAGWSLVVAYQAPGEPARNLTVFDGYGSVSSGDPAIDIRIEGFKAPPSGPVNATLGFITYEGDLGYTGDKVLFNGGKGAVQLQDAANPKNNFFNSTISNRGSLVSTKDPNYVNQMGFDADLVTANGVIANGATGATISLTTGGETYYPGVVTSAIELFAPEITVVKSVADFDGNGFADPNEVLTYTIVVSNDASALDAAVNVILDDAIPAYATYKPGSLRIVSGANAGAKSDAINDDQGEYFSGTKVVGFQLGTGAGTGTAPRKGGTLTAGQSTTVTFQVVVDAVVPPGKLVENTAVVSYRGRNSGLSLTAIDSADIPTPNRAADLAVTKTDGTTTYVPGTQHVYTIVVTNKGPSDLVGTDTARVLDVMPAEFSSATWTVAYSPGSAFSNPTSGSGDIDVALNLLAGGTATFTVTAQIRPEAFGNLSNTVTVSGPEGYPDPNPGDNTATDTNTLVLPANLVVDKRVTDLNGNFVVANDVLRYTITVSNVAGAGTAPTEAALGVVLSDVIPASTTYKPGTLRIVSGANAGAKTDAVDGDQAEFLAGGNGTVQFQLGAGAKGLAMGGRLAAGQSTTVTFDVIVAAGILPATVITNTARVTGTGEVSGLAFQAEDSVGIATPPAADLSVEKTTPATFTPGQNATFTLVVSNAGPTAVTGATVTDDFSALAAWLDGVTWTSRYANGAAGPSGSGSLAAVPVNLGVNDRITFTITAATKPAWPSNLVFQNTATARTPAGIPDPNPDNDTSTVTTQPVPVNDLAVVKRADRTFYEAGAAAFPVVYTITVTNKGPSFASQASVVDTLDPAFFDVAGATWFATFTGTGSTGTTSGSGSIGEIIDLAPLGTAVYTVTVTTRAGLTRSITNTTIVAPTDLATDPTPGDNTSTDVIEVNITPAIIVGNDAACDSTPLVRVLDPVTGAEKASFLAYESTFRGGVRVYGADVTGDGVPEIITAPGPGRPGEVRVFTQDGVPLPGYAFFPFGPAYNAGVEVAVGDVTGDGTTDLVAGQGRGGAVSVFTVQRDPRPYDPVDYVPVRSLRPFGANYRGGVTVATADMGTFPPSFPPSGFLPVADGIMELVVGSGAGMPATVNIYNAVPATPVLVNALRPISPTYARGVGVSALPSSTGGPDGLMVTAGTYGGSKVEVYRGIAPTPTAESFAAFGDAKAAVWAAAFADDQIYSVQGAGGTTNGVWRKGSGQLTQTTGIKPPLRVGVLRPPLFG